MSNLLQVSVPQVWADNLRSGLIKRLENCNISVEFLIHGLDRPPGKNATVILLSYKENFGTDKRRANGMKIYSRSRVMRLSKNMNPEAKIWLQRLKQLEKNMQNQRNDLDFQKFCYRSIKYFRKS